MATYTKFSTLEAAEPPATTISPKELTELWMTTLERENKMPWKPAGSPTRKICRSLVGWSFKRRRSRRMAPLSFMRQRTTKNAEMHWEMTVAKATPATSIFSTMTNNRFSTTLITPAPER